MSYNTAIFVELLEAHTNCSKHNTTRNSHRERTLRRSFMKIFCGALLLLLPGCIRVGAVAHV